MESPMPPKRARVKNNSEQDIQSCFSKCQEENIHPALSNHLVLQEIFKHLSQADLLNCKQVHKTWLTFLESSMYFIKIEMETERFDFKSSKRVGSVRIQEMFFNGPCKISHTNLEGLTSKLEVLRKSNVFIFIELQLIRTSFGLNMSNLYLEFLKEFGHRVYIMDYQSKDSGTPFRVEEYLNHLSFLPNLEILKLDELNLRDSLQLNFLLDFPTEISLPQVWKICVGYSLDIRYIKYILSVCGNVKELWDVPIKACDLIVQFEKVECVKSIIHSAESDASLKLEYEHEPWFESRLERFASLPVKLTTATLPSIYQIREEQHWGISIDERQNIKKLTLQILESSKDTAIYMTIPTAVSWDMYLYFPLDFEMTSVKILQFDSDASHDVYEPMPVPWYEKEKHRVVQESEWFYFPRGTKILRMFPNVEGLEITFDVLKQCLLEYFPLEIFGPKTMGSSMKKLKIHGASPDSYPYLTKLFPHVTHVEMNSTLKHFSLVFPIISSGWKKLENLTVFMISKREQGDSNGLTCSNLDSVLTGIPQSVCQELGRERKSGASPSNKSGIRLKRSVKSLLSFKHLRTLEFIVIGRQDDWELITGITVDYALKQLPMLEFSVRVPRGLVGFDELKTALEPVSTYIQVDNTYIFPELPFL